MDTLHLHLTFTFTDDFEKSDVHEIADNVRNAILNQINNGMGITPMDADYVTKGFTIATLKYDVDIFENVSFDKIMSKTEIIDKLIESTINWIKDEDTDDESIYLYLKNMKTFDNHTDQELIDEYYAQYGVEVKIKE